MRNKFSLIICIVLFTLILSSCGNNEEPPIHNHTYSEAWVNDASGHWHEADCEHNDLTSDYGMHMWNSGTVTSEPTVEKEGVMTYSCIICQYEKTEPIEKLPLPHEHTYSEEWTSDAVGHWHSANCEHTDQVRDYGEHNWDSGTVTTEPTEEAEGVKTYACTDCRFEKTEAINKLPPHEHSFEEEWSVNPEGHWHSASCEHTELVDSYGEHLWNAGTVTEEPTLESDGIMTYSCVICDYQKTEPIDKLTPPHEHTYYTYWSSNANGHWHGASCEHADKVKDYSTHVWNEGIVTAEPTEESEGVRTYACIECSYEKTETIDKLPPHEHTYDSIWDADENGHWHISTCEHKNLIANYSEHKWNGGVITTKPTYNKEGVMTYTCVVCFFRKTEQIDKLVPPHEHTYSSEWTSNEEGHWHSATCEHADTVSGYSVHVWDDNAVVITEPTNDTDGLKLLTCRICSYEKHAVIKKLSESYSVTFESQEMETYSISVKYGETFNFPTVKSSTSNNVIVAWKDKETGIMYDEKSLVFDFINDKTFVAVWGKEWSDIV